MLRKSHEQAVASGIYHSVCSCKVEWRIRKEERFPDCPRCHRSVSWVFTRSVYADLPPPPPTPSDAGSGSDEPASP